VDGGSVTAYYNEHDSFAAEWLRGLIREGLIPDGHVDERDIQDVQPGDLAGFQQCHFFAGIGGWAYALELAGWGDRPVWTGSCPCQPYSSAGKGEGAADARNLWPAWVRLIRECRPVTVFGEQVEAAVRHGWLDAVSSDVEAEGYAFGAVVLGAHSVGAPHIRQRLWWVADGNRRGCEVRAEQQRQPEQDPTDRDSRGAHVGGRGRVGDGVGYAEPGGRQGWDEERPGTGSVVPSGPWGDAVWIPCADGKLRPAPAEPALFPLASGIRNRVGALRGAGNAIVPQVAAEFIRAYLDA